MPPELPDKVKACLSCLVEWSPAAEGGTTVRGIMGRLGLLPLFGFMKAAIVPCAGVCAAYPVFGAPLAAVGLFSVAWVLHVGLYVLAPLNLLLLLRNFRRHGDPKGLVLGGVSVPFILLAVTGHFVDGIPHDLIWIGLFMLAGGALLDWRGQRKPVFS